MAVVAAPSASASSSASGVQRAQPRLIGEPGRFRWYLAAVTRPRLPEARIDDTGQVLIVLSPQGDERSIDGFAGAVVQDPSAGLPDLAGKAVYLRGDVSKAAALDLSAASRVLAIREGSHGDAAGDLAPWP